MQEYVVGKVGDIPDGKGITIEAGRRTIAVFRIGSEFFAIHNNCPHKGVSLCEGKVVPDKKVVRCPWHHAHLLDCNSGQWHSARLHGVAGSGSRQSNQG